MFQGTRSGGERAHLRRFGCEDAAAELAERGHLRPCCAFPSMKPHIVPYKRYKARTFTAWVLQLVSVLLLWFCDSCFFGEQTDAQCAIPSHCPNE